MKRLLLLFSFVFSFSYYSFAQTLNLPARSSAALTGSQFVTTISSSTMNLTTRENLIYTEIAAGNVPDFFRNLVPVTSSAVISGVTQTVKYYVIPDYLAIGSNSDYFLCPMSPMLAKKIGDLTGCTLPTRKMVNNIWSAATVHLSPSPITASSSMSSVTVFNQHNTTVKTQRQAVITAHPLGELVSGDKKDVVISNKVYNTSNRVVIYGWHYTNGSAIQPMSNVHGDTYMDYSHGIRLVQNSCILNGTSITSVQAILQSSTLYPILSDEGKITQPYYPYSTSCYYHLSPTANTLTSAAATTRTITVTSSLNCNWSATSSASWVTFSGSSTGSGTSYIQYNVTANTNTTARTATITIAGKKHVISQPGTSSSSPPSNDNCSNAQTLLSYTTCVSTSGNSTNASKSLNPITCSGYTGNSDDDVWYKFTAIRTTHKITVAGSSGFDAVVDIKSGTCASASNMACADATGNTGTETLTVSGLTMGSTYYIRVYNYNSGGGSFSICLQHSPSATKEVENIEIYNSEQESGANTLSVYPNPSNDFLNITYYSSGEEKAEIQIHNIQGQLVHAEKIAIINKVFEKRLSTENMPAGIYLIRITSEQNSIVQKLIVE